MASKNTTYKLSPGDLLVHDGMRFTPWWNGTNWMNVDSGEIVMVVKINSAHDYVNLLYKEKVIEFRTATVYREFSLVEDPNI